METNLLVKLFEPRDEQIHDLRNLGEALYHELRDRCVIEIQEVDYATQQFTIKHVRRADTDVVLDTVARLAQANGLGGAIRVTGFGA